MSQKSIRCSCGFEASAESKTELKELFDLYHIDCKDKKGKGPLDF